MTRLARHVRSIGLLTVALLGVSGTTWTLAHSIDLTGDDVLRRSHRVALGKIISKQVRWNESGTILVTDQEIQLEEALRGELDPTFKITIIGGELDGETHGSCLTTHFEEGRRYVLFLSHPDAGGLSPLVGADQGLLAERPPAEPGGVPTVGGRSPLMADISRAEGTDFDTAVERLRHSLARVPFDASTAATMRSDRPLADYPAKRYDANDVRSREEARRPKSGSSNDDGQRTGPVAPQGASVDPEVTVDQRRRDPGANRYHWERRPNLYVTFDPFPLDWSWSPHDQSMMGRWNSYADIFRVYTTPSGSWSWGNGRFELAGWPSDATMQSQFGRPWGAGELAVCFSRWYGSGPIVEADIAINPAFDWTTDDEWGTRGSDTPWTFSQTMLHELGHAWGLHHPWEHQDVWWDSVMNYAPKRYRLPWPTADDANAIRSAFSGIPIHDGMLSFYTTEDASWSNQPVYIGAEPTPSQITHGSWFSLTDSVKVENVGTTVLAPPEVEVYLTPARMSWSGARYLTTKSYSLSIGVFTTSRLSLGSVYVSTAIPPGTYSVGLFRRDDQDQKTGNDSAWSDADDTLTVTSLHWPLFPDSFGATRDIEIGPEGTYLFEFEAAAGKTYTFSTCPEDGGHADFDSVLELRRDSGDLVASSDDACGYQSRIVYTATSTETLELRLRGFWSSSYGAFGLYHRADTDDSLIDLRVEIDSTTGQPRLEWTGGSGPYDVERATRPDFSDGAVMSTQTTSPWVDHTPTSARIVYYRVR